MKHHVSNVNYSVAHRRASVSAQAALGVFSPRYTVSVETLGLMAGLLLLLQQREVVVLYGFIYLVYYYSPSVLNCVHVRGLQ